MTSIILELQELAANPNSDVEELLNKTYMVARKLKISKLIDWCQNELSGYQTDDIPDYRKFYGELRVLNQYNGQLLPFPFFIPDEIEQSITLIEFKSEISVIGNLLLTNKSDIFKNPRSHYLKIALMKIKK